MTGSIAVAAAVDDEAGTAPARTWRDFRFLWSGNLSSTLGDGALVAALPLLARSLTSDPQQVAAVATFGTLPWLLFSVVGGAIADRMDRRRLMIGTQAVQAVLVGTVALLVSLHLTQMWMLYVLAFGLSSAEILFVNASQAFVPTIVPHDRLETANGRLVGAQTVSKEFAGPPIGAALFAFALPLPFWLDAASFVVSLLFIARIRRTTRIAHLAGRPTLLRDIVDGLRWLVGHRLLLTLTVVGGAGNFCEAMALSTLVLFAHEVLHVSDRGYGLLLASMAVGALVGSMFAGRVVRRFGGLKVTVAVQIVGPLVWLSIGLFGRGPGVVAVLFAVFSAALVMWNVVSISIRQRVVPNELLGRVSGAARMLTYGGLPLGALAGGYLARSYGLVSPWVIGAVLNAAVVAVAVPRLIRHWER